MSTVIEFSKHRDEPNVGYDVNHVRSEFPILSRTMNGKPLVYLDSAASAQRPQVVIDTIKYVYEHIYANVHRGVYELSQKSTESYEAARGKVANLLNAPKDRNIVFTRSATEAINLVANSWGRTFLKSGDDILLSEMEHHSNIVPWQMLRDEKDITLSVIPVTDNGDLDYDAFEAMLTDKTKLVAITHMSNALGTLVDVQRIIKAAHKVGAKVLVDGSQAVARMPVDVQALDADFYVFTGHKLYGPNGTGALYAKEELLEAMPPYQGGGEMIREVSFEKSTWAPHPAKFEAGTPNIAGSIALGTAIDYVLAIGMDNIWAHEQDLLDYATDKLSRINGLRLIGTAPNKGGILSFTLKDIHQHDAGMILDNQGIAVRIGHHCAQPLMQRFGVDGTIRASFGMYTTKDDIDALITGVQKTQEIFS